MSVIKRLGNVARGKYLGWSEDEPENDEVARELAELEAAAAAAAASTGGGDAALAPTPVARSAADPTEAKRRAIHSAFDAGVLSAAERDDKLSALDAELYAPPTPRKRTL